MKKKIVAATLLASILLSGCNNNNDNGINKVKPDNNIKATSNINYNNVNNAEVNSEDLNRAYLNFVFNTYAKCAANEDKTNMMISPASLMFALNLACAGANGQTQSQIMNLYGDVNNPESQFKFTGDWINKINSSEEVLFSTANSVWLNNETMGESVNANYLNFIQDTFLAEANTLKFDDKALEKINGWVDDNTNGMIKEILKDLDPQSAAVLINAIAFEGKWMDPYEDYQVNVEDFRSTNGNQSVNMLYSTENAYFETSSMTGFMKLYEGGDYAFLAMLPTDEKADINTFVSNLTAEEYEKFFNSKTYNYDVRTKLPEFKSEYGIEMNEIFKSLGMTDAFNGDLADFKGIADFGEDANLFISKIVHKSFIEVDRNGTKASAATAIVMDKASAIMDEPEFREVYLDRPFAYAIIDTETGNPIFIGTVNSVETPQ